jgi:DNA-binding HxlR family transcriptional regulator
LAALETGPLRRTALRARIPGISDKVLTSTLARLVAAGILSRYFEAGVPPTVEYELTASARELWPMLESLTLWVETNPMPPDEHVA